MDPVESFNLLMEAMREGCHDEAVEHAENLTEWINKGGFAPLIRITADDDHQFLATDELAKAFCLAACSVAKADATPMNNPEPH